MNILRFINSKDIRKYLADVGYTLNALEAAWLIYQCRDATIDEKHQAWRQLIDTMPDCGIPDRRLLAPQKSLHAFLRQYMDVEDRLVKMFFDAGGADTSSPEKNCVYRFEYVYQDGEHSGLSSVFSGMETLLGSISEPEEDVVYIRCTKMQIDRPNSGQTAYLTPSLDLLCLDCSPENEQEDAIYNGVFDYLWFDFPTPFQKGDIVWDPFRPDGGLCGGPFVLTDINLEAIENEQTREGIRQKGDTTDMNGRGYFLCEDGSVYYEVLWNYMDLEFYEKELTGPQRTLKAFSSFLKGKIDPGLFARAYHQILMEEYTRKCVPKDIDEASLDRAGIRHK